MNGELYSLLQDTLRGSILASVPFFDRQRVIDVLDKLGTADESERAAYDPVLMTLLSVCVLQERFKLAT
jgi:asparagine synthase (glutamine-hydrolysing)